MQTSLLMVFVRNPKLGTVKTRLAVTVGDKMALEIYMELMRHTAEVTQKLSADRKVFYSEKIEKYDVWTEMSFSKALQTKGTLGQRMENAFSSAFEQGYKKVLIVGSDLYSLKASHIEKALEQLDKKEVVIGPAQDGGYYLLGLNKKLPALFCNKNWGTSSVLKETLKDLRTKSVALMEPLNDVDDFEDLKKETELLKKLNIDVKTYQRNC
ncbi:MAG: TIGR04282 family arsenosugar biosynthesis glycosyltransferase [Flavobacteriaceae bacterium]|tara:strand:- start:217 stop:849 length:633 start_codon:yes stop_codon:yes gene_type:complete